MSRLATACIVSSAALAAWLSQGTIAVTAAGGARVALLPLGAVPLLLAAAAGAGVYAARRAGASLAPLWLLVLVLLPWLAPILPPAFLIWSGPMASLVWIGAALGVAASAPGLRRLFAARALQAAAGRPRLLAGALALAVYGVAAWQVAPSVPGGDEPHYLIITQSLLQDGDLKIENNHRAGDYRPYFAGDLSKPDYRKRGRNGEIYSIHAPGLPALIAPAFAAAGYHGVVVFLLLAAASASALAWHLAWLVTGRIDAAWFGWAAASLGTSAIFHSFTVYPDGAGALIVLTGVWALLRADRDARSGDERVLPWVLHGAALALLPWIHTRFALLAGSLGALVLLRLGTNRNPAAKAVGFLVVPALSALGWVGFFISVYGTPDPSVPYAGEEGSVQFIPGGLAGLLFDQRFGLLAYSPVLVCAFAGLVRMVRERPLRRLGLELLFVLVPYLLAVTHFAMWWGGTSAPARFLVPMLPLLAIPAAAAWAGLRRPTARAAAAGALAVTLFTAAALVFVDGGRMAYNVRQGYALWLEWLNPAADLARGLPSWWRGREATLYREIAIWAAAFAAAWGVLRAADRLRVIRARGPVAAATAGAYALAVMAAVTFCWRLAGVPGTNDTPAQMTLLRRLASERVLAMDLSTLRRLAPGDIPSRMRIEPPVSSTLGGAGANDRPLYQVPSVPAGRYRIDVLGSPAGWLMVGIGRDQFSLTSGPLSSPAPPIDLDFPVDVRAIVIRGDEQARRSVRGVVITPISLVMPPARWTGDPARRAVRYGAATVFFLDDRSFAEPEAFWVGGGRTSAVVVQPHDRRRPAGMLLRNGPVRNQVSLAAGDWRADAALAPGEEWRIEVPLDSARGAAMLVISARSGFRPSDVDPTSRDSRFLGVWVKVLD